MTHQRRLRGTALICLWALGSFACEKPDEATPRRSDLTLLLAEQVAAQDSLTRTLVAHQRALFMHVANQDRDSVAGYLALDFTWGPFLYVPEQRDQAGKGLTRKEGAIPLFSVLAGALPPGLDKPASGFQIDRPADGYAVVIMLFERHEPRISTIWRRTDDGWVATRMTQLPPLNQAHPKPHRY